MSVKRIKRIICILLCLLFLTSCKNFRHFTGYERGYKDGFNDGYYEGYQDGHYTGTHGMD
jgi:hypothetical protein